MVYSKAKGEFALLRIVLSCVKDLGTAFCIPIYSALATYDTSFNEDLLKKGLGKY